MSPNYQQCTQCVMDTTDREITFDAQGVCNYCNAFASSFPDFDINHPVFPESEMLSKIQEIKEHGKNQEYDCIVGLSGGVDSSYVAYLAKQHGLRPLCVHFDSGWNSELAVRNIESIVNYLDFDLFTYVCDWREMKDLQLSFFKAGVSNCDIPQDHAFLAGLHEIAKKHNIKYLINGHNIATEYVMPMDWGYTSHDLKHILAIQKKFGKIKLQKYPRYTAFDKFVYFKYIHKIESFNILNHISFNKQQVKQFLMDEMGWRDYGGKHYESRFTKFFQAHYLPYKFNIDKRKAHYSSLILTGQLNKSDAEAQLLQPLYDEDDLNNDKEYIAKKLGIDVTELQVMLDNQGKEYYSYKYNFILDFFRRAKHKGFANALSTWRTRDATSTSS